MVTTKATGEFPQIEWEEMELLERDPDERMEVFRGEGIDEYGNEYSGMIYYFAEIFEKVEDIDKI